MNKLLKQLLLVLDEKGVQVTNLNTVENTPGYTSIEINKEISIEESRGNRVIYSLYTKEGRLNLINYKSLTEALDVLADHLSRVKEGDILVSRSGLTEFKVVAYSDNNLYNLFDVKTDMLLFSEGKSLEYIYDTQVEHGSLHVK